MTSCPTCLGSLESFQDLFAATSRKLLDLLQQLLGFEVEIKEGQFFVCVSCVENLNWISNFKDTCQSSYEIFAYTPKEELTDSDVGQLLEDPISLKDEDYDWGPQNTDSDSDYSVNNSKKGRKQHDRTTDKSKKGKPLSTATKTRIRKPLCEQFCKEEVLKAIAECTNYLTNTKNKCCIHCSYVASVTRGLKMHMKAKHGEFLKTWCSRCNLQTNNLQVHEESTKCSEDRCKFCSRTFDNINRLTGHLRSHCHTMYDTEAFEGDKEDVLELSIAQNIESANISDACNIECDSTAYLLVIEEESQICETEQIAFKQNRVKDELSNSDHDQSTVQDRSKAWTSGPIQLFPHEEVLQAISATRGLCQANRKCIICGFLSSHPGGLSNHMTVVHMFERHKWCRICNSLVDNLTKHRADHRKDLLKCTFCVRNYGSISHLNYHMKRHSNLYKSSAQSKWFSCNVCPNFYLDEQQLKDHKCTGNICTEELDENEEGVSKKLTFHNRGKLKRSNSDTTDIPVKRWRDRRLDQFPHEEVQKAINDTMKPFETNRKCIICAVEMTDSRSLSLHMSKLHNDVKDTWCSMCNTMVDNLRIHKEGHRNDLLKCVFCGRGFNKVSHLKSHLEYHSGLLSDHKRNRFSCDICPNTYSDEQQLKDHVCPGANSVQNGIELNVPISGSTKKTCSFCLKKFLTNRALSLHMFTHTGESIYKCSHCGKNCKNKGVLIIHERRHTGEKPYVCNICGKAFSQYTVLENHLKLHGSPTEECTICNKRYYRPIDMKNHAFSQYTVLENHLKLHGSPTEECTICNKRYCRPIDLKNHMKRHTGEKSYLCSNCGVSFFQKCHLIDHIKRQHSEGRPYKCRYCEKDFKVRSTRKNHEDIHRGIKPYKCSECSYSCLRSYRLSVHMRQHSADAPLPQRPHKCLLCNKRFSTQALLTSHTNNRHEEIV